MKSIYFDDNVLPCSIKLTIDCNFAINQLPWQHQSTANQIKVSMQVTIYGKVTVNCKFYATCPWSQIGLLYVCALDTIFITQAIHYYSL